MNTKVTSPHSMGKAKFERDSLARGVAESDLEIGATGIDLAAARMLPLLPLLFLLAAWLYAMVGFGGGSTYLALLAASPLPLAAAPVVALLCNIIVSGQGSLQLVRRRFTDWSLLGPLLVSSLPAAFLGGAWRLPEEAFLWILATALTLAGGAMLWRDRRGNAQRRTKAPGGATLLLTGAGLGFLAGITGIGGGIYLAPVMHLLRWAEARTVAACTSLFIVLNSLAGLVGQLTKGLGVFEGVPVSLLVACPVAVLVGGRLGTYFLTDRISAASVRLLTALVILLVAARLWLRAVAE